MKKTLIFVLLVLFCLGAKPSKKPRKELSMSTTWSLSQCPKGQVCSTGDGVDIRWNYDDFFTEKCKDISGAYINDYRINVEIKNTNKHPIKIDIQDFNAYAYKDGLTVNGNGSLFVDYQFPSGESTTFSYQERCFSAKTLDNRYVTSTPYLADLTITVTK